MVKGSTCALPRTPLCFSHLQAWQAFSSFVDTLQLLLAAVSIGCGINLYYGKRGLMQVLSSSSPACYCRSPLLGLAEQGVPFPQGRCVPSGGGSPSI